jgi:tetratricopeptide (TPR) repeat protein
MNRSGAGGGNDPRIIQEVNKILNQADQAIKQEDWQEATILYKQALAKYPQVSPAWTNLGTALMRMRQIEKAKEAFEEAINIDPNNADAHANMGVLLARDMHRPRDGEKHLIRALEINPNHPSSTYLQSLRASMLPEHRVRARALGNPVIEMTCDSCGEGFSRACRMSLNSRAFGGVECYGCGRFYCEKCVSSVIHGWFGKKRFTCACRKSKAWLGKDGCVAMNNFKEIVVFRA